MKCFKKIDFLISIILILACTGWNLYENNGINDSFKPLVITYFIVGGWQVISMLTHTFGGWFTKQKNERIVYHFIVLFSLITMPAGSFWLLYFTAPFMAVYYSWLCYREIKFLGKRPLDEIK